MGAMCSGSSLYHCGTAAATTDQAASVSPPRASSRARSSAAGVFGRLGRYRRVAGLAERLRHHPPGPGTRLPLQEQWHELGPHPPGADRLDHVRMREHVGADSVLHVGPEERRDDNGEVLHRS
jgi:hypothetical protein